MCFIKVKRDNTMVMKIQYRCCDHLTTYRLKLLEEQGGMPSGPGAFRGYICFKASLTSAAVKFLVNAWFIEGVTFGWTT